MKGRRRWGWEGTGSLGGTFLKEPRDLLAGWRINQTKFGIEKVKDLSENVNGGSI